MRICMVSNHGCIRVVKQSLALTELGHEVELLSHGAASGFNKVRRQSIYFDADQLRRSIAASDADVFHIHNEPDWMVKAVRDVTDSPIVFDCHDLQSMRVQRPPDPDEVDAFGLSDGFIHVSDPCRDEAWRVHPETAHKPTAVVYSMVNREFIDTNDDRDVSWTTMVYEGGLSVEVAERPTEKGTTFTLNLRSIQDVVKGMLDLGFNFLLLPARNLPNLMYENMGACVIGPQPYPSMLACLRVAGFGFVGTVAKSPLMMAAMPNKLFEYISQGVVPVIWNADEAAKWALARGLAIHLTDEIQQDKVRQKLLDEGPAIRKNVLAMRQSLTMENEIAKTVAVYEAVV